MRDKENGKSDRIRGGNTCAVIMTMYIFFSFAMKEKKERSKLSLHMRARPRRDPFASLIIPSFLFFSLYEAYKLRLKVV